MKICFATEVTYPNYVNRIKSTSLKHFLDLGLDKLGIPYYISTNLPNQFKEYDENENVKIFDIDELRINHQYSKEYELYPEDPKGIYPSRYPWNMRRFIIERAALDGYDYVVYIDADNEIPKHLTGDDVVTLLSKNYEENTIQTNSAIFRYVNKSPNDVFEYHEKYINYFNLEFDINDYDTLDGPVQIFIGKTNNDILRFTNNWHKFTEFGYKKEFGFGYGNNKHGNISFVIPISQFKLKHSSFPFYQNNKPEDRY
jgi:hypothetical protein